MGALCVVGDEVVAQHLLHFVNGLELGAPALDAEVLVEKGAVEALDDAVEKGDSNRNSPFFGGQNHSLKKIISNLFNPLSLFQNKFYPPPRDFPHTLPAASLEHGS
jgi:hypothetical protein